MNDLRRVIYRTTPRQCYSTPFFVRSCGYYHLLNSFCDKVKKKDFLELFWVVSGSCFFVYNNIRYKAIPGSVFFYLPGDIHQIEALNPKTSYYWVTFTGAKLPELTALYGIKRGLKYAGACPEDTFFKLDNIMRNPQESSEIEATKLAFSILSDAVCGVSEQEDIVTKFKTIVTEGLSNKTLEVSTLAAQLRIHRTTLHKLICKETGLSPSQFIRFQRIQTALTMLQNTQLSMKEIAQHCGFQDQNYFSKVIRQHFGHTPSEIRLKK